MCDNAIQNRLSLETRFWKSYKRNSDLKHGLNDVTVALHKRDKLRRMRCAMVAVRESQKHARGKKLLFKRSSVNHVSKPCFKSMFQNRDSRYAKSYKRSHCVPSTAQEDNRYHIVLGQSTWEMTWRMHSHSVSTRGNFSTLSSHSRAIYTLQKK